MENYGLTNAVLDNGIDERRVGMIDVHPPLQECEARPVLVIERDDLAVENDAPRT